MYENVVNLLLRLDCKESVGRGQNKILYNRIFIYNLRGIEKVQSEQIENNIVTLTEDSSESNYKANG